MQFRPPVAIVLIVNAPDIDAPRRQHRLHRRTGDHRQLDQLHRLLTGELGAIDNRDLWVDDQMPAVDPCDMRTSRNNDRIVQGRNDRLHVGSVELD